MNIFQLFELGFIGQTTALVSLACAVIVVIVTILAKAEKVQSPLLAYLLPAGLGLTTFLISILWGGYNTQKIVTVLSTKNYIVTPGRELVLLPGNIHWAPTINVQYSTLPEDEKNVEVFGQDVEFQPEDFTRRKSISLPNAQKLSRIMQRNDPNNKNLAGFASLAGTEK